jgi:ferredoxin
MSKGAKRVTKESVKVKKLKTVRVRVDPVSCDAYGYCAELLPERVILDEWGYPIVDGRALPRELVALAERAALDCPRRAFLVERSDAMGP